MMALVSDDLDFTDAIEYHHGAFPPENIDVVALLDPLVEARAALASYAQMLKNLPNPNLLLAPLQGQEAVASSRMEGTFSTLADVLRLQSVIGEDSKAIVTEDAAFEVFLYGVALRQAQRSLEEGYPINQAMIRGAHRTLLRFGRGMNKDPGQYKDEQNYIGDTYKKRVDFIPISPVDLPAAMESLVAYMHRDDVNSLIRLAVSHVEFEALHPFKDGNGRVGRMLITLLLSDYDLLPKPHFYLSGYFDNNKEAYIDAMRRVSSEGDWTGWCHFFFKAIKQQAEESLQVAHNIAEHYERMKKNFAECLRSQWSHFVLDYVFANPSYITSPRLAKYINTKPYNSNRLIKLLEDNNIITCIQEGAGRRAAIYQFPSLLDLVRQ